MVKVKKRFAAAENLVCVLFCITMSFISVKCTEIQYFQYCVCAENLIHSYENPQNTTNEGKCSQLSYLSPESDQIINLKASYRRVQMLRMS